MCALIGAAHYIPASVYSAHRRRTVSAGQNGVMQNAVSAMKRLT